jgi:hypothetical protein
LTFPALAVTADPVPTCLSTWDENVSIELNYNKNDRYDRTIAARKVGASCSQILRPGGPSKILPLSATEIDGIKLDKFHQNAIYWIRKGSNYVLPIGYTAKKYLFEHPIQTYSLKLNQELTQRFGHGFSGEIYREWLLSQWSNRHARDSIKTFLRDYLTKGGEFTKNDIRLRSQNTLLLVSMGLGWDEGPDQPFYVKDFLKQIQASGMETLILKRDAMGTIPENIRALIPQVHKALLTGKDIMVMGLCKGMPEVLAATAGVFKTRPDLRNKLKGVIGISPMMSGLYWADFQKANPGFELIHFLLELIPGKKAQSGSDYLTALETMNSTDVNELYKDVRPQIPTNIPFVNLVGVIPDNGILKNDTTAMMPFIKANKLLNIGKGANDGFLEYPKTQITSAWGTKVFNIPLEGSHMITDGKFDELDFRNPKNLLGLYYAILRFSLDQRAK